MDFELSDGPWIVEEDWSFLSMSGGHNNLAERSSFSGNDTSTPLCFDFRNGQPYMGFNEFSSNYGLQNIRRDYDESPISSGSGTYAEAPGFDLLKSATNENRGSSSSSYKEEKATGGILPSIHVTQNNSGNIYSQRDHQLYQNPSLGADGLYHCPWESVGHASCDHKPTQLKCNYDKFVDSHLKPYRCKVPSCEQLSFSSLQCLLRHERETHALHGSGESSFFLCTVPGCDRGVHRNGFPRKSILWDHMKRCHGPPPNITHIPRRSSVGTESYKHIATRTEASQNTSAKPTAALPAPKRRRASATVADMDEQFDHRRKQLLSELQQLRDPGDPETMKRLQIAGSYLKMMVTASEQFNVRNPTQKSAKNGSKA